MNPEIEKLKQELTEFLELNCLAAQREWVFSRYRKNSPKLAKMLLATIEMMDDMPFSVADALEEKLLNIWNE